jgi:GABA(A) receptor-associated protein
MADFFPSFVKTPLEERISIAEKIMVQFPGTVPVIVDRLPNSHLPPIKKNKFIIPNNITVGKFLYEIRKSIPMNQEQGLIIFIGEIIPPTSSLMANIYYRHKSEDEFLYVTYTGENIFG